MFDKFIELAKNTTLPTYNYPDRLDAAIALLSLSYYCDYRLFARHKGYDYHIGTAIDIPSKQDVINSVIAFIENHKSDGVFYVHELMLRINNKHFYDIKDTIKIILENTDTTIFDNRYRPQWFHLMSMAVDSGCTELFSLINNIVRPWWFYKIMEEPFDTVAGATKRQLIEHFGKMTCHTTIADHKQKQEICIHPSNMDEVTYWDATLLALGGSKEFSIEIANKLWKAKKEHYPAQHWAGSLRIFSWNYRGELFLSEKEVLHKNIPILSSSDVIPVINNKPVSSNILRYDLLFFSWPSELIYRLLSEYLCYDPEVRNKPTEEIQQYTEHFISEVNAMNSSADLGGYLFRELQRCLNSRPQALKEREELKLACNYALEGLHNFLDEEKLVTPHPEGAKTFVSTILSKNKTAATSWLLDYCLSYRPAPEYWINKCNTKKQVMKILSHLNIDPYDAIPLADEKHAHLIMELMCDE